MPELLAGLICFLLGAVVGIGITESTANYDLASQAEGLKQECEKSLRRDEFCEMQFVKTK